MRPVPSGPLGQSASRIRIQALTKQDSTDVRFRFRGLVALRVGMEPVVRESLLSLLQQQFGLASLPQMRELGVTRSDLQAARRQRLLERVAPSTWASPAAPRSFDFARMLALLACPDAMLSHRCAAQTLGFD